MHRLGNFQQKKHKRGVLTSAVGDFIHADDVADAIIALLALGGERIPGLRFEARESGEVDIDYDPHRRTGRWGAYDLSRIRADTGWRPRSLRESFHDYIDWLARSER